jgi:putative transposase
MEYLSVQPTAPQRQEAFWGWIDKHIRQLITHMIEKALQLELQARIHAGWNQRSEKRTDYRNGFYSRRLTCPYGPVCIRVPRTRNGPADISLIVDRYQRRVQDVDRILRHAYLLGTSTRATASLCGQIFGQAISHQTISQLMRWLDDQIDQWRNQPIEPGYKVVYLDGMHVDINGGDRMVMLVAGQRTPESGIEILGFSVDKGERCVELLADLRRRGLENVDLFISDQAAPIKHALEWTYPEVAHQTCSFHRLQTLWAKVGNTEYRKEMVREASDIFRCPSKLAANDAAIAWRKQWHKIAPVAVAGFMRTLGDSLLFYQLPKPWWKRVRTNNPMERWIRTLRMRLRAMGCFHDHAAIERAVFGQCRRWHKIKLTHNT